VDQVGLADTNRELDAFYLTCGCGVTQVNARCLAAGNIVCMDRLHVKCQMGKGMPGASSIGSSIQRGLFGLMAHVPESCYSLSSFPRGAPPIVHGVGHISHKLHLPHALQEGRGDDPGGLPHLHGGWKGEV